MAQTCSGPTAGEDRLFSWRVRRRLRIISTVSGLVAALMLLTCCEEDQPNQTARRYGLPDYSETGVVPEPGTYFFSGIGSFIVQDAALHFSEDYYRYDEIAISDGEFHNAWGTADANECPHCSCPTDGYAISGHFTTSTSAEGVIIYGACFRDFPVTGYTFTATRYRVSVDGGVEP